MENSDLTLGNNERTLSDQFKSQAILSPLNRSVTTFFPMF